MLTVTATSVKTGEVVATAQAENLAEALSLKSKFVTTYHKNGVPPGSTPAFLDDDDVAPKPKKTPVHIIIIEE